MNLRDRLRTHAALLGAVALCCLGALLLMAVLGLRKGAAVERRGPASASVVADLAALPGAGAPPPLAPPPRPRAVLVEHDDVSRAQPGGPTTVRHLLRATVPVGLSAADLRRCIDELIDHERLRYPQVDAVAVYLYEPAVYARFTGRVTDLAAALAHGEWAPGGNFENSTRAVSGMDNATTYALPGK